jgi:hypothetical protein
MADLPSLSPIPILAWNILLDVTYDRRNNMKHTYHIARMFSDFDIKYSLYPLAVLVEARISTFFQFNGWKFPSDQ